MGQKALPERIPTLKEAHRKFEKWRKRRKQGEAIPERLWDVAVKMCAHHPVLHVARALRLNYKDLKDRTEQESGCGESVSEPVFVELDMGQGASESTTWLLELEDGQGRRMRVSWKGLQSPDVLDLLSLTSDFWRAGR